MGVRLAVRREPRFVVRRIFAACCAGVVVALAIPLSARIVESVSYERLTFDEVRLPAAEAGTTPQSDDNPIATENQKPGTSAWRIEKEARRDLEGYASRTSVTPGERLTLYVSTEMETYDVEVYRMGWYGGDGGRLVWEARDQQGVEQPPPRIDDDTRMVEARWQPSVVVPVGADWLTGAYLAKLVVEDGRASYVPFTVREGSRRAPVLFQSSVTTWQAYNLWGGHSLYLGRTDGGGQSGKARSYVVSFDRPYSFGSGAADFLGLELPLLAWLEQRGYDVGYATNIDTHEDETLLDGRKAFLSMGHDEYWSTPMRDHVESAIDDGVNLAFFGANAIFRHIRLEPSPLGPNRREVNYRGSWRQDPVARDDPTQATVDWRNPPLSRPEDAILGAMYECNPVKGSIYVYDPLPWLFEGTGLEKGDKIEGILGSEYDRVFDDKTRPQRIWALFRSPVRCKDDASVMDSTFARMPSGAGVFNAATSRFLCVFSGCPGAKPDERVQRMVANLLDAYLGNKPSTPEPDPARFTIGRPTSSGSSARATATPRSPRLSPRSTPARD